MCSRCVNEKAIDGGGAFPPIHVCGIEDHLCDAYDNDWYFCEGEPLVKCEYYEYDSPFRIASKR
ncbi:hypothetical protein JHD46_05425 [Sulfurimonas sp. SAG-AH-194-C20]|nr:hypothetical protein [Sulfurimonas sp. SAG-AH-194-C20]MDF1879080.1 hypothetical protein [Sulfurimonas sp. SAG-AH-194-C20]